jgi:hypothetical protein
LAAGSSGLLDNLDDIAVKPLNRKLIEMSDTEAERRAAADPYAA